MKITDSVPLAPLLRPLAEHKGLAALLFLVPLLAAAAFAFLRSPVYESQVMLIVGAMDDGRGVESPSALMEWLRTQYQLVPWRKKRGLPRLESVGYGARQDQSIIALKTLAHTPDQARNLALEISQKAIERHRPMFDRLRAPLIAEARSLDTEIENLQSKIKALSNNDRTIDPSMAIALAIERTNLARTLTALKQQKMNVQLRLSRTLPTRRLSKPTLPEVPVRPRPVPILITGFLIGLFTAVSGTMMANSRDSSKTS